MVSHITPSLLFFLVFLLTDPSIQVREHSEMNRFRTVIRNQNFTLYHPGIHERAQGIYAYGMGRNQRSHAVEMTIRRNQDDRSRIIYEYNPQTIKNENTFIRDISNGALTEPLHMNPIGDKRLFEVVYRIPQSNRRRSSGGFLSGCLSCTAPRTSD